MSYRHVFTLPAVACALLTLAGCLGGTSPPARFYTLTGASPGSAGTAPAAERLLFVGPVTIPDYLDRPQIVTRSGGNELVIDEIARWGGSLEHDVNRNLVAELSQRLGASGISVVTWQAISFGGYTTACRLPVTIARFDGSLDQEVVLIASWQLLVRDGATEKLLLAQETVITEPAAGSSHQELVAAMGRALRKFGEVLAGEIASRTAVRGKGAE